MYDKNSRLINKIIFFVEDDQYANESTTFMLSKFFPNIQNFFDGKEVLEAVNKGIIPDLIISDINMPIITGLQLVKKLKESNINIPTILLTAHSDNQYLQEALDLNIDKYITKPLVDIKKIVDDVYVLLEKYDNQKIKDILNNNSIFTRTDLKGVITHVSKGFCDLTGYTEKELIGNRHNILRFPAIPKSTYKNLWDCISQNKIWKGELKNIRKDGSYYWIEHTISPDYDESGNKIGYVSLSNDITNKKDFEDKHLRLLQEAKHASIEELLENISHQWRQPLNLIALIAGQLEMDLNFNNLSEKEKLDLLHSIVENCDKLSNTIETFTNYVSNDKSLSNIILENEIKYAIDLIKSSFLSNKINIIDKIDYDHKTEKILVQNEVSQVLINILTNSKEAHIKDENKSNKWVEISTSKDDEYLYIIIKDNAIGIDEDIIDRVFEPYFTTKFKSHGAGLGLHLTKRIIEESFKGEITLENIEYDTEEKGLKVCIKIPLS